MTFQSSSAAPDLVDDRVGEVVGEVDPADLGTDRRSERLDGQRLRRHGPRSYDLCPDRALPATVRPCHPRRARRSRNGPVRGAPPYTR